MKSTFRHRIASSFIIVSLVLAQSVAKADLSSSTTSLNDMLNSNPVSFSWPDTSKFPEEVSRVHAAEKRTDFSFSRPQDFQDFDALIDANATLGSFKYAADFKWWWIQHWSGEVSQFSNLSGMNWQLLFIRSYADFTGGLAIKNHDTSVAGSWLEENLAKGTMKYLSEHSFKVMISLYVAGFASAVLAQSPFVFTNNLMQHFAAPVLDAVKAGLSTPNQGYLRQLASWIRGKLLSDAKLSKFCATVDSYTGEMLIALEPLMNEDPKKPLTKEQIAEVWTNYGKPAAKLAAVLAKLPDDYYKNRTSFINFLVNDPLQLELAVTQLMQAAATFHNKAETAIDQVVHLHGDAGSTKAIRALGNQLRSAIVSQMRAESLGAVGTEYQQAINTKIAQLQNYGASKEQIHDIVGGYEAEYATTESASSKFAGKLVYQPESADLSSRMDYAYRNISNKSSLNYFSRKLISSTWDTVNQIRAKAFLPVADLAMFKRSAYYPSVKDSRYQEIRESFSRGVVNEHVNDNSASVSRPRSEKPKLAEEVRGRAAEIGEKR